MNLYKVLFEHYSQKDSQVGIKCLLLADNDEQVYHFIDEKYNFSCWKDEEDEDGEYEIYNDDYDIIGTESFKERMLRLGGQMFDGDYELHDLYYGLTLYGWELVQENVVSHDYTDLIAAEIVFNINNL